MPISSAAATERVGKCARDVGFQHPSRALSIRHSRCGAATGASLLPCPILSFLATLPAPSCPPFSDFLALGAERRACSPGAPFRIFVRLSGASSPRVSPPPYTAMRIPQSTKPGYGTLELAISGPHPLCPHLQTRLCWRGGGWRGTRRHYASLGDPGQGACTLCSGPYVRLWQTRLSRRPCGRSLFSLCFPFVFPFFSLCFLPARDASFSKTLWRVFVSAGRLSRWMAVDLFVCICLRGICTLAP